MLLRTRYFISFIFLLLALTGCDQLDFLFKEIHKYGHIPYPTPLEFSGPGTMVGGSPQTLNLVAAPDTCFPDAINGIPTDLRRSDRTTLPKRSYRLSVSGALKLKLLNFLQTGNPVITAGTNFSIVHTIELEMTGVHVEYLDSIRLTEYYRTSMPPICKEYLDKVGFIIQALKVDKLNFKFLSKSGQRIYFQSENLENIVDIGVDVTWEIENGTTLVITTPKYIGYQLGSLRLNQDGMVLYRASKIKRNKFQFIPITVFKDINDGSPISGKLPLPPLSPPSPDLFNTLSEKDFIDAFSKFLDG